MLKTVIIFQLSLLIFHQATTLFNLYPFNNVKGYSLKERLVECIVNGTMMAVPLAGFYFHVQWMMVSALIIYPALLVGEYLSWWQPYFFGATEAWQKMYDRLFRNTIIVLPHIKNHPVPNLEHVILHGLTLITSVIIYIYYFTAP